MAPRPFMMSHVIGALALVAASSACRDRRAPAGDPAASADAAATPSASTPMLTAATASGENPAKLEPPPLTPKPRPFVPRMPVFETVGEDGEPFGFVRVVDRYGIAGRVANARMAYYWLGPAKPTPGTGDYVEGSTAASCAAGVVTARVLSGYCTRTTTHVPAPGSRAPGWMEGRIVVANLDFPDAEGPPISIGLTDLFRLGVDARKAVLDACASAIDVDKDTATTPTKKARCTADAFVLMPEGLHVMWSDDEELSADRLSRATIPWRVLGAQLRKDGPACSFEWTSDSPDDAPDAAEPDPCR